MGQPTYDPNAKIKIVNTSPRARTAAISIGDVMIPVHEVTVTMKVGELTQVTLTTRADQVDVEALQDQTKLIIQPVSQGDES